MGGSVKARSSSPHTHALLSDVSDLSSVSSAPEPGVETLLGSAAASQGEGPPTQVNNFTMDFELMIDFSGRECTVFFKVQFSHQPFLCQDLRPQIPVGGGGSRFLKKAPPPAIHSSQSPVHSRHMQQVPEHRYVCTRGGK